YREADEDQRETHLVTDRREQSEVDHGATHGCGDAESQGAREPSGGRVGIDAGCDSCVAGGADDARFSVVVGVYDRDSALRAGSTADRRYSLGDVELRDFAGPGGGVGHGTRG